VPDRSYLRSIRRGEVALAEVIEAVERAERGLLDLAETSTVPDDPDRGWVDGWLHRSHLAYWQGASANN
jgi:hypothetical protein